jgi:serine/threonine protein kinase
LVYMAYDTHLDLRMAIKVISPEFECSLDASRFDDALKRFESEAKIAAKIDHANLRSSFSTSAWYGKPPTCIPSAKSCLKLLRAN